jgi:hypothetical protein
VVLLLHCKLRLQVLLERELLLQVVVHCELLLSLLNCTLVCGCDRGTDGCRGRALHAFCSGG